MYIRARFDEWTRESACLRVHVATKSPGSTLSVCAIRIGRNAFARHLSRCENGSYVCLGDRVGIDVRRAGTRIGSTVTSRVSQEGSVRIIVTQICTEETLCLMWLAVDTVQGAPERKASRAYYRCVLFDVANDEAAWANHPPRIQRLDLYMFLNRGQMLLSLLASPPLFRLLDSRGGLYSLVDGRNSFSV